MKTILSMAMLLAFAGAASAEELRLVTGKAQTVTLRGPAQVICDDLTVVRVDTVELKYQLTGLKPGATKCGFYSTNPVGAWHIVYDVTVVER